MGENLMEIKFLILIESIDMIYGVDRCIIPPLIS